MKVKGMAKRIQKERERRWLARSEDYLIFKLQESTYNLYHEIRDLRNELFKLVMLMFAALASMLILLKLFE